MPNPLVSVVVSTYNHQKYIADCLEGILMQQTTFPFEIILGEDESNDGTREICMTYAEKHPDKIKLFLRSRKDVIYIGGNPTGRYNFLENLKASKGKYIALCEGDDYWTDPLKLQKQVDFMEENTSVIICFHKVKVLKDGKFVKDKEIDKRYNNITTRPITINDLIEQGNFIHTPSVVFRNVLTEIPVEFSYSPVGDYFLYIILAENGYIKRLNEDMAVYRRNVGVYSTLSNFEMKKKMIMYQSSILSYLKDPDLKTKLLTKQAELLVKLKFKENVIFDNVQLYHSFITWKKLLKIFLIKVENILK